MEESGVVTGSTNCLQLFILKMLLFSDKDRDQCRACYRVYRGPSRAQSASKKDQLVS